MMTISHYISKSQQTFIKLMGLDLRSELLEKVIPLKLILFWSVSSCDRELCYQRFGGNQCSISRVSLEERGKTFFIIIFENTAHDTKSQNLKTDQH